MVIATRLDALDITLPTPPKPIASYVPAVRAGNLLIVSGQLPMVNGKLIATGHVPADVSIEQAAAGARQCAINALAIVIGEIGDWALLKRVVRLGVFVNSCDDFTQQSVVANGASDLLVQIFGDAGKHARAAVGVNTLPLGAAVEAELMVELNHRA